MLRNKRIYIYGAVFVATVVMVLLGCWLTANFDSVHTSGVPPYRSDQTIELTGWQYRWGDSPISAGNDFLWLDNNNRDGSWTDFQFPGRPPNSHKYRSIWIKAKLPDKNMELAFFRFRTPQNTVEVYLEDQLIYSYGTHNTSERVRTPGSTWHFAKLPGDFAGKTVYLRMSTPFPHLAGYLTQVAVGNKGAHYMEIILSNSSKFISGVIFIFIGLAILLFQVITKYDLNDSKYLALGSIFIGGWFLSECSIFQLFTNAPVSMTYSANFFIYLTPMWLIIYIKRRFMPKHSLSSRLLHIQIVLHGLLALISFVCDFSGLMSILYFVRVFHVLMVLSLILVFITTVKAASDGVKGAKLFVSGTLILGVTALLETFNMFYDTSPMRRLIRPANMGMLYFLITLLVNAGKELKQIYDQIERHSKETETNYKSLFTNMSDGFTLNRLEYDEQRSIKSFIILEANEAFANKVGKKREELIGSDLMQLFPEIGIAALDHASIAADETTAAGDRNVPNDAVELMGSWYKLSIFYPKKDYISIIFSDVTGMKKAEETIRRQAYTDSMTGFFNRRYFEDAMLKMNAVIDTVKPLSIIVIDIDGLKITNDTFGHNAGDELLKKAADIIKSAVEPNGLISRIGGDEFCILLPNTDHKAAQETAEQIVKITDTMNSKNSVVPISMSVGVATSEDDGDEDVYSIYRTADDNMYRYKISQSSSEKSRVIDMLLYALSEKDYVSQGHVKRISQLCQQLADSLEIHDSQKRNLVLLSKVHDLGKIGIPDDILNKPEKLTRKEYEKMKSHVKIGFNIASRSKELVSIAPLILHHHEYWNGKGYPSGLKGEEIPLECRILAIIDAFDAMTNDRPYHKGTSVEDAIGELKRCAGKQFDPSLVKKFIEIIATEDQAASMTKD